MYVKIPEGYEKPEKVCLLNRAMYGLKQTPSTWNKKLTSLLKQEGMIQLRSDQCIFKNVSKCLYLAIHVDNGIIMGRDTAQMNKLLQKLEKELEVSIDTGLKKYLGIKITRTKDY